MIKRWSIALIFLSVSFSLIWVGRQLRKVVDRTQSFETFLPTNIPQQYVFPPEAIMTNLEIHGRKIIGTLPKAAEDGSRTIKLVNKVSPNWKRGMERTFMAQGGTSLKDINITKLGSFIWSDGGQATNVETVRVTLQNENGQTTKFNAMVDSQSGRIIQTWNQPVIDPLNPREKFRVKIDPRYLQD